MTRRLRHLAALLPCVLVAGDPPSGQDARALSLERGDVVCLVGNALAERMQHHGWLETRLHARFPAHELVVRNLGFGADEVAVHPRTMNFGKFPADGMELTLPEERFLPWDRYLDHCGADVVLLFLGFNESFAGAAGLEAYRADLARTLDHLGRGRRADGRPRTLVLFGSLPFEERGGPPRLDGAAFDARLARYDRAGAEVARAKGVRFVELSAAMRARYAAAAEPLTINGVHLTEEGNRVLAEVIEAALFGEATPGPVSEELRAAVLEKNAAWFDRYRTTDGYNVYGGRSRQVYRGSGTDRTYSNWEVLQREMEHLDARVAGRDRRVWARARGEDLAPDDAHAPPLLPVVTNQPGEGPEGAHRFLVGPRAEATLEAAPGLEVALFADERRFPELVNPVQMAWDPRGRLWVATWPTYPRARPDRPHDDKLLILDDVDGDGRADTCEVFAGDLHNPTGFEFWNGGVLLAAVPDLLFLRDTDGDDRADVRERLLHGIGSADTHHSANSFVLGPDGALYFQEGTFHRSQIETPYGPVRSRDGCVWRFEPRTFRVERYVPYDFANPHGHVFDRWGQDFVTDGTGNVNYYALPFSGHLDFPDKHRPYFPFFLQRSRPVGGTEILSSRHFPEAYQGSYLAANVIGFRGVFQYRLLDDGAGFGAQELAPIVESSDPNFRPVDLEVGPDGALYLLDWHNPLIGHLQHHIRDPSRDAHHGRVYRVTATGRPLLEPVPLAGAPLAELLDALTAPEDRTRYRARIELSGRDTARVLAAARTWIAGLDARDPAHEHHLLEALWLHQQHDRMDRELLLRVLASPEPRARAAATRVVRQARHLVPDALALLAERAEDAHPRVRLEAVVGASFFPSPEAARVALLAFRHPTDRFLDYALDATLRALEPHWKAALRAGEPLAQDNPVGVAFLLERVQGEELLGLPRTPQVLAALLTRHGLERAARADAASALAAANGRTPSEELLAALEVLDEGRLPHAAHTARELGALLLARLPRAEAVPRARLATLARSARQPAVRAVAQAALVVHDGEPARAWDEALRSPRTLRAFLEGIADLPELPGDPLRAGLHERVRPLAFATPFDDQAPGDAEASQGPLLATFYAPAPPDATRETLAGLVPRAALSWPRIALDVPPARGAASFGLTFEALLEVPAAGDYTFFLRSDDGSRLYVGDTCVVDNDGAHAVVEARGSIRLAAGPHPVLVTFFEQGGDEALELTWQGPGFERGPIPAERWSPAGERGLREAAVRALAHLPGHAEENLRDAERLVAEDRLVEPTLALVRSLPPERTPAALLLPVLEALAARLAELPDAERASARNVAVLETARELSGRLPAELGAGLRDQLEGLGTRIVLVRTRPHQMLYDLPEFWVEAGASVTLVFQNNDVMPHNLVVAAPGALTAVGQAAERLSGGDYVPDHPGVLWHTRLLFPGQSERLTFTAPAAPGEHPYLCTYPGHWRVMNGVMHVVESLDEAPAVVRRAPAETATARRYVRDWTVEELAPRFGDGWERGRDTDGGRALFTEAGCVRCHGADASVGGPELPLLGERWRGVDLLRHVIEPSLEVREGFAFEVFELANGSSVSGRVVEDDGETLGLVTALLQPEAVTRVPKAEVRDRWLTPLSPMPTGLLVTLDEEEVLDLMAYVQSPDPVERSRKDPSRWITYEGTPGLPGNGKHVLLLAGDEEYRSEEALPMLARILAVHHGFRATVLFATNPETGAIDPDEQTHIPGMHLLAEADMLVCFLRFRELPDEDMRHFADYVESGRPILGIRTATHAFAYGRDRGSPYAHYGYNDQRWEGGFGQQILGETWINHHGRHGSQSTRGVIAPGARPHPILRGVHDVWGPTDVYGVRNLDDDARVLVLGQVLDGMQPDSPPAEGAQNDPMMPLVWLRELRRDAGPPQRVVTSTIGASVDLLSEDLRRLFVNACYWGVGLEAQIPARSRADVVGAYQPTMFGFGKARKGLRARELLLEEAR